MASRLVSVILIAFLSGTSAKTRLSQQLHPSTESTWSSHRQALTLEKDSIPWRDLILELTENDRWNVSDARRASGKEFMPSVIAKVQPLFFQRASMVMVQLVRDHLSKTFLGSLETYADGELSPYLGVPLVVRVHPEYLTCVLARILRIISCYRSQMKAHVQTCLT